jgi:hypothetical protein
VPLEAELSSPTRNEPAKLRLDFKARSRCGPGMDDDTSDLIAQLCTRIGMIMEDASVTALTVPRSTGDARRTAIGEIGLAAKRISALVAAVEVLSV